MRGRLSTCGRKRPKRAATLRVILAAWALIAAAPPAAAQDATWLLNPGSNNFNTGANWSTGSVPTGTAFFDVSTVTNLTNSANTTIGSWTFNVGASNYTFTTPNNRRVTFNGAGIVVNGGSITIDNNNNFIFNNAASAGNAVIANTATVGNDRNLIFNDTSTAGNAVITNNSNLDFNDSSTAGSATITNNDVADFNDSSTGGTASITNNDQLNVRNTSTGGSATIINNLSLEFFNTATAGSADITNNVGGTIDFNNTSTGGSAAITNNGTLNFRGTSTGGNAAIVNNLGGQVNFSTSRGPANDGRISAGSIAGAGNFLLGDNELTVGGNNQSTTVSGVISDTGVGPPGGSLVKTGTGTLTLSGTNTYAGSTTINTGTLALSGTGSIAASAGVDVANAAGVFDISATAAGATIKTLSGVANSSVVLGNQTLTLSSASGSYNGVISGVGGGLTLSAGTETLTGVNTYTGATTVNGGTLLVDGSIAPSSGLTVNSGGTIGGTGTLPTTSINGGILAPGPPIGTLSVQGNLSFTPASTYQVDISPTSNDRTNVTGTATLAGTVHVIAEPGNYPKNKTYTILTASGGLIGTFSALDFASDFLCACLSYDANNVYLQIVSTGLTFAGVGQTPNQIATGAAVEQLGTGNPIYDVVVLGNAEQARTAFDLLSGEIHASAASAMLDESRLLRDAVFERLRQPYGGRSSPLEALSPAGPVSAYGATAEAFTAPFAAQAATVPSPAERVIATWAQAIGAWGRAGADGNAATLTHSTGGLISGLDATFGQSWRLGIAGGYSRSRLHADQRSSSAALDNYHLGFYGGGQFHAVGLRAGLANTWHDISTSRSIGFLGGEGCCVSFFSNMVNANYQARSMQAFGEAGVALSSGGVAIEPFANVAYVEVHTDGFAESGGAAALTGEGQSNHATFATLGARAATTGIAPGGATVTARGTLGWRHAFGDLAPSMTMAFANGGTPFDIAGVTIARDSALVEASVDLGIRADLAIGLTYSGQFSTRVSDHSVKGSLVWKW